VKTAWCPNDDHGIQEVIHIRDVRPVHEDYGAPEGSIDVIATLRCGCSERRVMRAK
jgi:hypothetical protein